MLLKKEYFYSESTSLKKKEEELFFRELSLCGLKDLCGCVGAFYGYVELGLNACSFSRQSVTHFSGHQEVHVVTVSVLKCQFLRPYVVNRCDTLPYMFGPLSLYTDLRSRTVTFGR